MCNRTVAVFVLLLTASLGTAQNTSPPPTPKKPVSDVYYGVTVTDEYQWLEDGENAEVQRWSDGQNRRAHEVLDQLPGVPQIRARVTELLSAEVATYRGIEYRAGNFFVMKSAPPKQQPFLIVLNSPDAPEAGRVLVDPNEIDKTGGTAIDFWVPSLDGKFMAVSMSRGGSESGDVSVYDVATGKKHPDLVPRVNGGTAGGSLAWNGDSSGFFYTRYPRGNERPAADMGFFQQIYYHKLGDATGQDRYELGRDFPRIAEIQLETSHDGRWTLASVANGDGGEFEHFVRGSDGRWTQLTQFSDKAIAAALGLDNALYLLSRNDAPRGKLLRLPLSTPTLGSASVVVPQSDATIAGFLPTATKLFIVDQLGGPSRLRRFDTNGRNETAVNTLPVSTIGAVTLVEGDNILFQNVSYVVPPAWFRYSPRDAAPTKTKLFSANPANFSDTQVLREVATSKDGTKVPVNILRRTGVTLDHSHPTWLTGYGGYGVSHSPAYSAINRMFLEHGGVIAIANLRGGGEFGESWHAAGNLLNKQNVFDDFAAAMQLLIDKGYTSRDRLAIEGGSNGGLLMGAMITQHPDLMKAVVSHVGIYDMLRVELSPNGAFNVTEFGTVKNADQFKAMYAYSPYHHVKDGTAYPAVLLLTGANDPRVEPWHSRKMTARLQAACPACTVLLRTSATSGHGLDTGLGERIEQAVDVYAFLFDQLGVKM